MFYIIQNSNSFVFSDSRNTWKPQTSANPGFAKYINDFLQFVTCLLRSISSEPVYHFSLTNPQVRYGQKFLNNILSKPPNFDLSHDLHNFIYSLIGDLIQDVDRNQWLCPLTCWLAISSVRPDGKFVEPKDYTPKLAWWTYHLRCIHLFEAAKNAEHFPDRLTEYVLFIQFSCILYLSLILDQSNTNVPFTLLRKSPHLGILFDLIKHSLHLLHSMKLRHLALHGLQICLVLLAMACP